MVVKLNRFLRIIFVLTQVLAFNAFAETAFSEPPNRSPLPQDRASPEYTAPKGKAPPEEKASQTAGPGSDLSVLRNRVNTEKKLHKKPFIISLHRPNYFLGATYNQNPNRELYESVGRDAPERYEAKFQLSVRMLVWPEIFGGKADLYAAYTQKSLWQIYSISSPFRETNYEPEVFLSLDTDFNVLGLTNRLFILGANHQSNGMGPDLSRSWNRLFMQFVAERGNFVIGLKAWSRIHEDAEDDDNPDIEDYLGYGHIFGAYKYRKNVFSFLFRNNLDVDDNKIALELGWSYPIISKLRVYAQYFYGYGESLADYNVRSNRIGFGVMINDWI